MWRLHRQPLIGTPLADLIARAAVRPPHGISVASLSQLDVE